MLTRARTGGFRIRTYSKNFDLVGEITRTGYVSDIGYLADGRLYICESSVSGASLVTALSLYTPGRDTLDCTVTADGFAYRCGSLGGGFYLLTASSLTFFDKNGEKTFSTSFGTSEILFADGTADGVAVYVDENVSDADCAVYAFFADGTSLSSPAPRGARSLLLAGRQVCLLADLHGICQNRHLLVDPCIRDIGIARRLMRFCDDLLLHVFTEHIFQESNAGVDLPF